MTRAEQVQALDLIGFLTTQLIEANPDRSEIEAASPAARHKLWVINYLFKLDKARRHASRELAHVMRVEAEREGKSTGITLEELEDRL